MAWVKLYLGDCLTELERVPDESVTLCFVDPPYNIGIFCKMEPAEYLEWCEQWIALVSRKLTANGAFWVSHKNPRVLGQIADRIEAHGRGLINWVTWDKYNDAGDLQGFMDGYTVVGGLRSFQVMAEYLIYHAGDGVGWSTQEYLASEWKRAGLTFEDARQAVKCAPSSGLPSHWFTRSQWALPTEERYNQLRAYANTHNHDGEYLRREYEDLRYTFNNPGKVSSVWQIPPAKRNGHLTPKPEALLERIILATSNERDTVLDPMMGSGTALAVAARLGRSGIGCEINKRYFEMARKRIEQAQTGTEQLELPGVQL